MLLFPMSGQILGCIGVSIHIFLHFLHSVLSVHLCIYLPAHLSDIYAFPKQVSQSLSLKALSSKKSSPQDGEMLFEMSDE